MKRITICLSCGRAIKHYGSYAVKNQYQEYNPLTGVKEVELIGKVCPACAVEIGYRVKGSTPAPSIQTKRGKGGEQ